MLPNCKVKETLMRLSSCSYSVTWPGAIQPVFCMDKQFPENILFGQASKNFYEEFLILTVLG